MAGKLLDRPLTTQIHYELERAADNARKDVTGPLRLSMILSAQAAQVRLERLKRTGAYKPSRFGECPEQCNRCSSWRKVAGTSRRR
jgi:hypothetical protein